MRLIDVVQGPWAITPKMLDEVQGIYLTHLRGEKIDIAAVEAKLGRTLSSQQKPYELQDGVAILCLDGVIAKKANLFMQVSGGVSTQMAAAQFDEALADDDVSSILLVIDSPGGTVDGTQELVNKIYAARGQKPIIALADGLMASAAYWVGSAADSIFAASDTTEIGSIGVVAQHMDTSAKDAQAGVKRTEVYAGKYKRIASSTAPLTDEGKAYIQDSVDSLYSIFVDSVARNRGMDTETVLRDMADGRVFLAQDAVKRGLVDGVATQGELLARLAAGDFAAATTPNAKGPGDGSQANSKETVTMSTMTIEQLRADHPDIAKALVDEGHEQGRKAGGDAERERIQAVLGNALPGHETLVQTLAFDGKTSGPEAAQAVLSAEKSKKAKVLDDLRDDAPKPVQVAEEQAPAAQQPGATTAQDNPATIAAKASAYQAEQRAKGNKISAAQAVVHVTQEGN